MNREWQKEEYGTVKYVRVQGEYRFTRLLGSHKTLVGVGETVDSAGFIRWSTNRAGEKEMAVTDEGSLTLRKDPHPDDERQLADLLGWQINPELAY